MGVQRRRAAARFRMDPPRARPIPRPTAITTAKANMKVVYSPRALSHRPSREHGMEEFTSVRYETAPPVARITIDRPEKRNALNVTVMTELRAAFGRARADEAIRVVVLTGAGDKAFSAGGDLGGFTAEQSKVEQHRLRGTLADLFEDMTRLGKPIIARVNGHALAGGFGLMCACDLVVAADTAEYGMPEINTGLWPFIITAVVRHAMPERKALELMMTGERVD